MVLGDVIKRLEAIENKQATAFRGFGEPHSWRGVYMELAFDPAENVTIQSMLDHARSAVGRTFTGWKGGEFRMGEHTECWIDRDGECNHNTVSEQLLDYIERDAAEAPHAK